MVDNKGWRKKIGGKPKELSSIRTGGEETAAAPPTEVLPVIDLSDRRRHGWRKTISTSRSVTPMIAAPPTPTPEDFEDTRSERSEASTPRRSSKPKLIRYSSLFGPRKEELASSDFAEPWSADAPSNHDPWAHVDPIVAMESIHSHLCKNHMVPVPLEHNSGLFQIFDDYRKLRWHKEHLEEREKEAIEDSRKVKAQWIKSEERYEAEIRRLELLIARGVTGMTGLIQARQGTVVDHNRRHRKTISTDRCLPRYQHMSILEIDGEIRARSQQVRLYRPTSPSGKMTALSRQLTEAGPSDLPIGTPPGIGRASTLSRKVKSELNLMDLHYKTSSQSFSSVVTPDSLRGTKYRQEETTPEAGLREEDVIECDAFVALRELGALVARRKGLNVSQFVNGVMALFASGHVMNTDIEPAVHAEKIPSPTTKENGKVPINEIIPRTPSRKPLLQSQQRPDQRRLRHFSFEPGDDQVRDFQDGPKSYDSLSQPDSTNSESSSSAASLVFAEGLQTDDSPYPLLSLLSTDLRKPSMIPSPVQTMGRVRRENSKSSLQSVLVKSIRDDRHNSCTSIQTAFRETPNVNASVKSKSRSSSNHNLRTAESPLGSKERLNSLANRHSTAALAAARAAEARSNNAARCYTQQSTTTPPCREGRSSRHHKSENTEPTMRDVAGRRDAE